MLRTIVVTTLAALTWHTAARAVGGGDILFPLQHETNVLFSHDYHTTVRGVRCAACHFQKFAKGTGYEMRKEQLTKLGFCAHCHNGMKGFDVDSPANCIKCHKR